MPGITLMTGYGIKDGTVGVVNAGRQGRHPTRRVSNIVSNAGGDSGVKAGDIVEANIFHD